MVEAENLAKRPAVNVEDFSGLAEKSEALGEKAEAVKDDRDFTALDGQQFSVLNERFQKAWAEVMRKLVY